LLTPGVFLRVGDNTLKLVSTNLANTEADLIKGQRDGLCTFDADQRQVRVLRGEATVQDNDQQVKVKDGCELDLNQTGRLKAAKFDKTAYEASDLYRFSDLRSSYLAEANVDMARQYYAGGPGWYGRGWYWDPWFWSYT